MSGVVDGQDVNAAPYLAPEDVSTALSPACWARRKYSILLVNGEAFRICHWEPCAINKTDGLPFRQASYIHSSTMYLGRLAGWAESTHSKSLPSPLGCRLGVCRDDCHQRLECLAIPRHGWWWIGTWKERGRARVYLYSYRHRPSLRSVTALYYHHHPSWGITSRAHLSATCTPTPSTVAHQHQQYQSMNQSIHRSALSSPCCRDTRESLVPSTSLRRRPFSILPRIGRLQQSG